MGIKLIILLALLIGVLYSLHLLVKDYQALTAGRLLRFLFKRDVSSQYNLKPGVRWKAILRFDPVKCAQYLYCDLGARPADNAVRRGFAFMLTLEPQQENRAAWEVFKQAYRFGQSLSPNKVEDCHLEYSMCPFHSRLLFNLIDYMSGRGHQSGSSFVARLTARFYSSLTAALLAHSCKGPSITAQISSVHLMGDLPHARVPSTLPCTARRTHGFAYTPRNMPEEDDAQALVKVGEYWRSFKRITKSKAKPQDS